MKHDVTTLKRSGGATCRTAIASAAASLGLAASAHAAPVPLLFNNPSTPTNVAELFNGSGAAISNTLSVDFTNVATDGGTTVDARVTATVKNGTAFGPTNSTGNPVSGFLPNYNSLPGTQPQSDLGFLFYGSGVGLPQGIALEISFFDGTAGLAGSFSNPFTLSAVDLLVYDVDGEPFQSEGLTAFTADGLVSYSVGNTPQRLTPTPVAGGVQFDGPGQNFSETDASGAVLLNYENTNSITLDFVASIVFGPQPNGMFAGIDGQADLIDVSNFAPPVSAADVPSPVPLPSALPLFVASLAGLGFVLRRRQGSEA